MAYRIIQRATICTIHCKNLYTVHAPGTSLFMKFNCHNNKLSFTRNQMTKTESEYSEEKLNVVRHLPKSGLRDVFRNSLGKVGILVCENYRRRDLLEAGHILLNSIYMKVDFESLNKNAQLEDTFEMWLQIVYMHVWMLLVRLHQQGNDGKIISKALIGLMWKDIDQRLTKIQDDLKQHLQIKKQMKEYVSFLLSSFLVYDDGILKDDQVLAGSIWNQIYGRDDVDPTAIESLVHYIRFTTAKLDDMSMDELVFHAENFKWSLPPKFGQYPFPD